jgi:hypothetical protein
MEVSGIVTKRRIAQGTKSEHDAVLLCSGDEEFILRRQGGNPFHDDELEKLVGKTITATGVLRGNTLIASNVNVLE